MSKPKGIGYCHTSPEFQRSARALLKSAKKMVVEIMPLNRREEKELEEFKRAIARFEKVNREAL